MNDDKLDPRATEDEASLPGEDALMTRVSVPPEFAPASREQIEQTWSAIVDHIEDIEDAKAARSATVDGTLADRIRSLLSPMPAWTLQVARVAALVVVGFGIAWIAATQGWLPGTVDIEAPVESGGAVDLAPDRSWLAASDYGSRLEALLLGVTAGDIASSAEVVPAAREVSRGLLNDNRLYQRAAERRGDPELSRLFARMEIILLALATAPEGEEQEVVNTLRRFIDESDLLGDLREVHSSVPSAPRPRATTVGS